MSPGMPKHNTPAIATRATPIPTRTGVARKARRRAPNSTLSTDLMVRAQRGCHDSAGPMNTIETTLTSWLGPKRYCVAIDRGVPRR